MLVVIKKFAATSKRLLFYDLLIILLWAEGITIINVEHFFEKRCLVALSVRNLIVLTKFSVRTVSRFSVFLVWYQYRGLGKRV